MSALPTPPPAAPPPSAPSPAARRVPTVGGRRRRALAAATLVALAGLAVTAVHAAPAAQARTGAAPVPARAPGGDVVQKGLDNLVTADKFPGAMAALRSPDGRTRNRTAGVGDRATGAKVPADGRMRAASATKMFTATVVLQLVGEGKVELDAPIEKYLPNLIRGNGIDGRKITVRQLLQHTSGLPEFLALMPDFFQIRHTYFDPRRSLDLALKQKATFPPGTGWQYSNTNYLVAGLLIQKVTGRPVGEQITRRVIDRAGLRHTYWPGIGDQTIRGAHPHGYHPRKPGGTPVDVTTMDPSMASAAGQLISRPSDLNRFLNALLGGALLKPAQLAQMQTTVKAPGFPSGWRYGLGLMRISLSCGGFAWGHGGDIEGFENRNAATPDGRAATVAVTALPPTPAAAEHVNAVLDAAMCDRG